MQRKPIITIRMFSNEHTLTVADATYDVSKMNKDQRYIMRRVIIEGLFKR